MPTGPTPTVSVTGRNVVVSWSQVSLPNATPVTAYQVGRFSTANVAQTIGSACSGTVNALTCTEAAVPAGTWKYTASAKRSQWVGTQSSYSSNVIVAAPSLSFSSSTTINTLAATLNGTIASYVTGETITFRLDNATSGTVLSSTVTTSPIPFSGTSTFSVTIPTGITAGAHTVYAVGSAGSQSSAGITVNPNDTVAPTVSAATIAKTAGGVDGYVKQGGTYYVYAQVTDTGSPATGVSTVRANVSTVTTGATNRDAHRGQLHRGRRQLQLPQRVADRVQPPERHLEGVHDHRHRRRRQQRDDEWVLRHGRQHRADRNEHPDDERVGRNHRPRRDRRHDHLHLQRGDGAEQHPRRVDGRRDAGHPATGPERRWRPGADPQRRRLGRAAVRHGVPEPDRLHTANRSFDNSTMVMSGSSITITLGTPDGAVTTAAGTAATTWTPAAGATDWAANACSTTTVTESGAADKEF